YSPQGGGNNTTVHTTGSGPLTYVANPGAGTGGAGTGTMSLRPPTHGGTVSFVQVGTAPGLPAGQPVLFTPGPPARTPPGPGGSGAFRGGRDCGVAEFTTPSKAFAAPSSFTLSASYGFECLPQSGTACNGAGSWGSSLDGTATLHTASTTAAEPVSLIVVAAG